MVKSQKKKIKFRQNAQKTPGIDFLGISELLFFVRCARSAAKKSYSHRLQVPYTKQGGPDSYRLLPLGGPKNHGFGACSASFRLENHRNHHIMT